MSHERSDAPVHCPYCGAECRTEIIGIQSDVFGTASPVERIICPTCRNYVHIDELKEGDKATFWCPDCKIDNRFQWVETKSKGQYLCMECKFPMSFE